MNIWEKKIPTVIGLLLIVLGIGATSYLVQSGVKLFSHASPSETPRDYRLTNITDSSFTVTYKTDTAVIGSVSIGEKTPDEQVVLDDRDQPTGKPQPYTVHSITIRNLHPLTNYVFSITSGASTFLNNSNPFTATTAPQITNQPLNQNPIAGSIVLSDGSKPQEALVIMTAPNSQLISALVNTSGKYALPTNTLRSSDLKSYVDISQSPSEQLIIFDNERISRIILPTSVSTVPLVTLGSNYDFSENNTTPLASGAAQTSDAQFPKFAIDTNVNITEKIITPSSGESFTDNQPEFTGTAAPNTTVTIEIHSDPITTTVNTNAVGTWTYRPTQALAPGTHTITVTTKDQNGILKTITNTFSILAAGTQVAEAATPSATLTPQPSATPTAGPTTIPTVTPTTTMPSPTTALSPTVIPTTQMTKGPTPTPASGKLPDTGPAETMLFGMLGLATTVIGVILFVATKTIPL